MDTALCTSHTPDQPFNENQPIKMDWIKKKICYLSKKTLSEIQKLRVTGWKLTYQANGSLQKANLARFIAVKVDFKTSQE